MGKTYCWIFGIVFCIIGCKPAEEILAPAKTQLTLSADTLLFDTVYSGITTFTLRLKVTNPNENAIRIKKIGLGGGTSSPYALIINGRTSNSASDVLLLGRDSLWILVKVTINPQDKSLPYIVTDSVVFETDKGSIQTKLVAWGQDAHFLNNVHIKGAVAWDSTKPYIVYGQLKVDSLAKLTLGPGTKIFFAHQASALVYGEVNALGQFGKEVICNTFDLTKQKSVAPGLWKGWVFAPSSQNNRWEWTNLLNAQNAVTLQSGGSAAAQSTFRFCKILHQSQTGITNQGGQLHLENSLVANCAKNNLSIQGGQSTLTNSTFATYSFDFFRDGTVWNLDFSSLANASFPVIAANNNIVWGGTANEITYTSGALSTGFTIAGQGNVLKTNQSTLFSTQNRLFDFVANRRLKNDTIRFNNVFSYEFAIDSLSPAYKSATPIIGINDGKDLNNTQRPNPPSAGCYEPVKK